MGVCQHDGGPGIPFLTVLPRNNLFLPLPPGPNRLSSLLAPSLPSVRGVTDILRPASLCDQASEAQLSALVHTVILCCAGLVQYLIDSYPADLPEYDPV